MANASNLLKNTLIYSVGNLGSKILVFLLVPLYSFYLTKGELGYYDILITTVTLLVPLVTLQMTEAVYRWLLDVGKERARQEEAISTSFLIYVVTLSSALVALGLLSWFIPIAYQWHFCLLVVASSLFQFSQQLVRGLGLNKLYSASGILNTFALLLINVAFLMGFSNKLAGLLWSTIIANLISVGFIYLKCNVVQFLSFQSVSKAAAKAMLAYAWPLIPNAVSWWMINLANRYIVVGCLGAETNGIFALSNRFPSIIIILNSIFMLAWQDHVITENTRTKKSYTGFFDGFMRLELTLVLALIAVSRFVIKYLVDAKFYEAWQYMPLLYIGVAFSAFSAFLGTAFISAKKTKGIFYTTLLGGLLNVGISYSLIGQIGLYAPAVGTLAGFMVIWLIRLEQLKPYFEIKINWSVFALLMGLIVGYTYLTSLGNDYIDTCLILLSIAFLFVFNKKMVSQVLSLVESRKLYPKS